MGLGRSGGTQGSPPRRAIAPATNDALRAPRRGTSSAHAQKCVGIRREGLQRTRARRRVLHSVRRPVHVNRGSTRGGKTVSGSRVSRRNAVGQTWATRMNRHRGGVRRAERGSSRITGPARGAAWCVSRKGRRSRPSSLRGFRESRSKCPHVMAVAEVVRRRLSVPNTLVRSAPKRVAARVNGGLARGHRRR